MQYDTNSLQLIQLARTRLDPIIGYSRTVDDEANNDQPAIGETTHPFDCVITELEEQIATADDVEAAANRIAAGVLTTVPRATNAGGGRMASVCPAEVINGRTEQVRQHEGRVIQAASWEETVRYMSEATGSAVNVNPLFVAGFQLAFKQYARHMGLQPDKHFPPSLRYGPIVPDTMDPETPEHQDLSVHDLRRRVTESGPEGLKRLQPTTTHWRFVQTLREKLKHERDKIFLEHYYGHLETILPGVTDDVPKMTWREATLDLKDDTDHSPTFEILDTGSSDPDANDTAPESASAQGTIDMF